MLHSLRTASLALLLAPALALAQTNPPPTPPPAGDEIVEEEIIEEDLIEEDFGEGELLEEDLGDDGGGFDYSQLVQTAENRAYASAKIVGQIPTRLFSVGYDVQGPHTLMAGAVPGTEAGATGYDLNAVHGERLSVNYPVYSKNHLLLNLGVNYAASRYAFEVGVGASGPVLAQALDDNGLRTLGFTATAFKPLNERHFLLIQAGANLNGDYALSDFQSPEYTRYTAAVIYGQKPHERKMWGVGLSRTYLGGALNYLPVYYHMYTAPNEKWGVEMLLPARALYRRTLTPERILTAGWEFQGNTFRLNDADARYGLPYDDLELRRSELRFRASLEQAITSQIWLSLQAGYRYNWQFDLDRGDFVRLLGDDTPFLAENDFGNPVFVNVSINWVSR